MNLSRIRMIAVLAVSQIVGWGTTFDMPGVLGRQLAAELGMANEVAFAGLSVMMLTTALLGPFTGRLIARRGASQVLSLGSLIFAAGLCLMALATGPVLYFAGWLVLGVGGAFGLSVPVFAAVVEREGADAKRIIGLLMIFTGLSAAICWPVWHWIEAATGWRAALALAAALHLAVILPLHRFGLPPVAVLESGQAAAKNREPLAMTGRQARLAMVLIGSMVILSNLVTVGIAVSLIELLKRSGASPELALTLGALRSVFGISARAFDIVAGRRASALTSGIIASGLILVSMPILALAGGTPWLLLLFVACYGFGSGISAVTRALLPLGFFSPARFAQISANLSLPSNIAMAVGPVIMTAVLDRGGMTAFFAYAMLISVASLAGLVGLAMIAARAKRPD